jgi:SAM-dependent methyltransferase
MTDGDDSVDRDHAEWAREVMTGYDDVADTYDAERDAAAEVGFVESLADALDSDDRVLDAGCGGGKAVLETLADDVRTVGLDVSAAQLALAGDRVPSAALARGDMARLPFADGAFDAVCSLHAMIHVPREHHGAVFEEFARICRPGARFLVTAGTGAWEGENDDWLDSGASMQWSFPETERSRELLRDAGFAIDEETVVDDAAGGGEWLFLRGTLDG